MKTEIEFKGDRLEVRRTFDADRRRVFRAWSEARHFEAWAGCPGATSLGATLDFRVGGRYRNTLRLPDGSTLVMSGEYLRIVPPEHITYTVEWEGLNSPTTTVTVDFRSVGRRTRVVLVHAGLVGSDMHREVPHGWTAGFDRLADSLADSGDAIRVVATEPVSTTHNME